MPLILGLVALLALGLMALLYPRSRRGVGAVILLAFLAIVVHFQVNDRPGPALISTDDIVLDNVSFQTDPRLTTATGRLINNHQTLTLSQITLTAYARDCPEAAATSTACVLIGQTELKIAAQVPSGQARGISAPLRFANLPELQGEIVYSITLSEAFGRPENTSDR